MTASRTEVIVTVEGEERGRYVFEPGEYVIGRSADCAIRVEAGLVSRNHARLTVEADGWLVEDLGSSNGTLLDGEPVTAESRRVEPAQTIRIGSASIVLRTLPPENGDIAPLPAAPSIREILPAEFAPEQRYAIGKVVAQGGMGAIFSAGDQATRRNVAMKIMLDQSDRDDLLRFVEEAQITAQLEHPNIVPVHELSINEQDQVFYTMKFIGGITLRKVLQLIEAGTAGTIAKYPLATLLTVFQKVCDALAFAHSRGVIHRDLKPENIMIGDFGEVLVMDWGLAKLLGRAERAGTAVQSIKSQASDAFSTVSGTIMGTPQYMSPEQAQGLTEKLDARSDIYALGALLYHLLTLHAPVEGPDVQAILAKVIAGEIDPPATFTRGKKRLVHLPGGRVPDALSAVVMKAMAPDHDARYQSVAELQADLTAYQNGFATAAEHASFAKQLLLLVKRHKMRAVGASLFFILIAAFMAKVITDERHGASLLERLKSTGPILRAQAEAEIEKGEFARALEHIDYAVELAPNDPGYRALKGNILQDQFRFAEARDAYASALKLNPNHEISKANLPLCDYLLKQKGSNAELPVAALTKFVDSLTAQGRLREAVIAGRPLAGDRSQLVTTWKTIMTNAGIASPDVRLLPDGRLHVMLNSLPVEDISFLRGAPLGRLEANNTRIADLSPLHDTGISDLAIEGTQISDLRPLEGLPLTNLTISRTKVSDLTPLHRLPLKLLRVNTTLVRDLSPLHGVPLEVLGAEGLGELDIAPLAGMPLRELSLLGTVVRNLIPLQGMKLQKLTLGHVKNANLAVLQGMPLEELRAGDLACTPPLFDLAALRGLPLQSLELDRNPSLSDLSALRGLPLAYFKAFSTGITNLEPLEGTPLVSLDVCGTKIRDFNSIAKMTSLRTLKLDGTLIADLTPLRGLPLAVLQLNRCMSLRDVSGLAALHGLRRLSLPHQAQGVGALRALPDLRWIAYGTTPPESDGDGSRARQFWEDHDLEQTARSADPAHILHPSRFPGMARRFPSAVQNGTHWYFYFDVACSWPEAKEIAALLGGHLATITSKEEDDFVTKTFGPRLGTGKELLLGALTNEPRGTFKWITGEPWSYDRWARKGGNSAEPSGGAGEIYLALRNGTEYANNPAWNDTTETGPNISGFLVEWED